MTDLLPEQIEREFSFAYTPAEGYKSYPPFINMSVVGMALKVIVRGHERPHPQNPEQWLDTGEWVEITLPIEALHQLRAAIEAYEATRTPPDDDVEALRAERDALLERPMSLAKMDSIDGTDTATKMVAAYWHAKCEALQASDNCLVDAWQPIETAPNDGDDVLLARFFDDGSVEQIVGARWGLGWGSYGLREGQPIIDPAPTHWRPLPEPPAALKDIGR